MKKVRLAAGSAMAAACMLTVPVAAAHAATNDVRPGTTMDHLRLEALKNAHPGAACGIANSADQFSPNLHFFGYIAFDGPCVHFQGGTLDHSQTGLTERVRFYTSGRLTRTVRNRGIIESGATLFGSYPNYDATLVCEALVANGTSTVKYGQVCEYTSE